MFFFYPRNEDRGLQLVLDWVKQDLQERKNKLHPLLGKYPLVQLHGVSQKKGSAKILQLLSRFKACTTKFKEIIPDWSLPIWLGWKLILR